MTFPAVLSHYRILEPLGSGGMGEVYAAEDTRLHRRVALKVLPRLLALDPERRERFAREAQAIAALNHPNIVVIHSVEEADGTPFLTMELVEGKALSEMIPRGGLPLGTLLKIGIAISDAMAAAQQRGITHRDLKPANVMVTGDGRVKVLDFGLAKLRDLEVAEAADDLTRAKTRELTGEGKIIGTVAYMSPEQAEGKPVDPRSDIFSLGVLLHEMAIGDRPFKGDTNVSIISSILKDTPASVTDLNPALPADLARIVRRCLAKDPARRYQTAADLRNELEDLKQDVDSGVSGVIARPAAMPKRGAVWMGAAAAAVALIAAAWFFLIHGSRGAKAAAPFTIDHLQRLTTTGTVSLAAISPDGRYIAHVKGSTTEPSLWVRQTAITSDMQIVPPAPVVYDGIAFSPDGNYVYYNTYPRPGGGLATLYRIPVLGGVPTQVLVDADSVVAFAPDGRAIAFMRGAPAKGTSALVVGNADGSGLRELAQLKAPQRFRLEPPAWSPDGKTLLATATTGALNAVFTIDAESGRTSQIRGDWAFAHNVQWHPDGASFFVDGVDLSLAVPRPQIWRVSYPSGERTRVTNDLNSYQGLSLSADGLSLATVETEITAGIETSSIANPSAWRRITGEPGREDGPGGLAWLPDGRIVFASAVGSPPHLWIVDSDGSHARQLTSAPPVAALNPFASPDGRWVYFDGITERGRYVYRIAPDGSALQQITRGGDEFRPLVSPDGSTVYLSRARSGPNQVARVPAGGGDLTLISDLAFGATDISPDGTRLLGLAWRQERARSVVALLPVHGGEPTLLSDLPPVTAVFAPDGRAIVYADVMRPIRLRRRPLPDGPPAPIGAPIPDLVFARAVSRDGRIAISRGTQRSDAVLITAAPRRP